MDGLQQSSFEARLKAPQFVPPSPLLADGRLELLGASREDIAELVAQIGEPGFRVKQIWHWLYHHGVRNFDQMANISKPVQQKLAQKEQMFSKQTGTNISPLLSTL